MFLTMDFILVCAVLQVQSSPSQSLQFQFVKAGNKAQIKFVPVAKPEDEGLSFNWYRSVYEGIPLFITSCNDVKPAEKFVCKRRKEKVVLEISETQRKDSGLYLCGQRGEDFHLASALVVGDSYTPKTQVMILQPAAQGPSSGKVKSSQLACLVQGVSNLVEVSWDLPGALQQKGQIFLVKNISGSSTFLSLLPVPIEVQRNGGNVTCEVRFNSSGTSVRKRTTFSPSSSEVHEEECRPYIGSLAGFGGLAFLFLLLGFLWNRFSSFEPRCSSKISEPSCPDVTEEGLCYAQLDLPRRTQDRKKRK